MRLSRDFMFYEIDGEKMLVCLDSRKFAGIVKLNSTAAFIADLLKDESSKEALISAVIGHYSEVDEALANTAVDSVLESLRSVGALEE